VSVELECGYGWVVGECGLGFLGVELWMGGGGVG